MQTPENDAEWLDWRAKIADVKEKREVVYKGDVVDILLRHGDGHAVCGSSGCSIEIGQWVLRSFVSGDRRSGF